MAKTRKQAQALAIKLSRERRSGKKIPAPPKGRYSERLGLGYVNAGRICLEATPPSAAVRRPRTKAP